MGGHCVPLLWWQSWSHNPLVREFTHMLTQAGRHAAVEQRDPSMGPNAWLDIVDFASNAGGPAAYDVGVVTPLRDDAGFREACAAEPGLAAGQRHVYKLNFTVPPSLAR